MMLSAMILCLLPVLTVFISAGIIALFEQK
jgi:hypothetical protein